MAAPPTTSASVSWTVPRLEELILTLPGVLSAGVVARPGGAVEEIHLLTDEQVTAKQAVRNVESALRARYDLTVDHRRISVARTAAIRGGASAEGQEDGSGAAAGAAPGPAVHAPAADPRQAAPTRPLAPEPSTDGRRGDALAVIAFAGLRSESRGTHVAFEVDVDWAGRRHRGSAEGSDLQRNRLETVGDAAVAAVQAVVQATATTDDRPVARLSLDGVEAVHAFGQRFVLVSVHALGDVSVTRLSGSCPVEDSLEKAVILATLQATDPWIRASTA